MALADSMGAGWQPSEKVRRASIIFGRKPTCRCRSGWSEPSAMAGTKSHKIDKIARQRLCTVLTES